MMMLKISSPIKDKTRVVTAPFVGGKFQSKKNTLWTFHEFTDFALNGLTHQYFLFKTVDGNRVLASGNLVSMRVEVDLEKYQGDEYIESYQILDDDNRTLSTNKTTFKLNLTTNLTSL